VEKLSTVDALVRLSFQVQAVVADVGARHDLSVTQVRLLGVLRDRTPGMQELAGHLGLDKSSVSGLIDRAEKRGLVRRKAGATDRRLVHVMLTAAGRRLASTLEAAVAARMAELVAPLTVQQERDLVKLTGKLLLQFPSSGSAPGT
jgi:DNA-binding MarR family transcriptional regulator